MWVAVPKDGQGKGEEEEEGGRVLRRPEEREDLPANRVKHCVIQVPMRRGEVGKRAKDGRREGEGEAQHEWREYLLSAQGGRRGGWWG